MIFADFLIAKHVNHQIHGNVLQVFVSVFPVPNMTFPDLCFSCKDLSGLRVFVGFLSVRCGG